MTHATTVLVYSWNTINLLHKYDKCLLLYTLIFYAQANVPEQIEALTNISMVQNLDLTTGDIILLIETVNEVLTGNSNVSTVSAHSMHELTYLGASSSTYIT